jgi:ethanolamine ammonia-lyase small subunit
MPKPATAPPAIVNKDPWERLKTFTAARIAMGRAGVSVPTASHLDFQLSHAKARDAVHLPLDKEALFSGLGALGLPVLELNSRARDRREYLLRPDLGRRLDSESVATLQKAAKAKPAEPAAPADLVLVIADGLSSSAIERQTIPFLRAFLPLAQAHSWRLAKTVFVNLGRVAVGDEVGEILGAKVVAVLVGERPGLSSPDSMGIYMTYAPVMGLTDERRNCISNIRPEGQPFVQAARTLEHLLAKALAERISGVDLKDDQALPELAATTLPA